jgi:hypothetical protein
MKRGLLIFAIVNVVLTALSGGVYIAVRDSLGVYAGLVMLPLAIVPFIMAYVAHSASGATGNPFRGLIWGQTWWYFAAWLLGILGSLLVTVIMLGLGAGKLDLGMTEFIQTVADVAAKRTGAPLPDQAMQFMSVQGWIQLITGPTIGAWMLGALGCLASFPWLGWFGRRMLVFGRAKALWALVAFYAITSCIAGLVANPMDVSWNTLPELLRMGLAALVGLSSVPAAFWLFLRTRSAALPALASASYQAAFAVAAVLTAERAPVLAPPNGLLVSLGALLIGMALWLWKDPGGMDLAVAAVAFDGTPLTPQQAQQLQAETTAATQTSA